MRCRDNLSRSLSLLLVMGRKSSTGRPLAHCISLDPNPFLSGPPRREGRSHLGPKTLAYCTYTQHERLCDAHTRYLTRGAVSRTSRSTWSSTSSKGTIPEYQFGHLTFSDTGVSNGSHVGPDSAYPRHQNRLVLQPCDKNYSKSSSRQSDPSALFHRPHISDVKPVERLLGIITCLKLWVRGCTALVNLYSRKR